jgi:hypothetical protein
MTLEPCYRGHGHLTPCNQGLPGVCVGGLFSAELLVGIRALHPDTKHDGAFLLVQWLAALGVARLDPVAPGEVPGVEHNPLVQKKWGWIRSLQPRGRKLHELYWGRSTVSITWITPLVH